ncbi:MAG: bifunctional 4-hydroxy-2-oxoglutarate aldolase/2-dehydro-3-deoxy-phosphogluconate aldolase [Gammaproteobacteria bacterium]
MAASPVMPVIVLDHSDDAVPLARALMNGGIRVLEVTMRTATALDSIHAIRSALPDALVGAGTVTKVTDLEAARAAGAQFAVSPGTTPDLLAHARGWNFPFLPGAMTPSDVMRALEAGFTAMKLFPARQAGGIEYLKALAGPFPQVRFCPTGGIDAKSAASYLALPNVACVGGSWLTSAELIASKNWSEITRRAEAAAQLTRKSATVA